VINRNKSLTKAYNKRAKQLTKTFTADKAAGLLLFVEHLRFMRDNLIIGPESPEAVEQIATLVATVAEFEAYNSSDNQEQKTFHLNNFCELVKLNIGEWLVQNDSI
jgi:hypothetical protein